MFWPRNATDLTPIAVGGATRLAVVLCVVGVFYLGICPNALVKTAKQAFAGLNVPATAAEVHTAAK